MKKFSVLVLAGNYHQYRGWLYENKIHERDARYICNADDMRGLRDYIIIKLGTWYERPIHELDAIHNLYAMELAERFMEEKQGGVA